MAQGSRRKKRQHFGHKTVKPQLLIEDFLSGNLSAILAASSASYMLLILQRTVFSVMLGPQLYRLGVYINLNEYTRHATPLGHNPRATPHPLATIPRLRHTPWPQSPGHATPLGHNPRATPLGHNPPATPHPLATIPRLRHTPWPQSPGHATPLGHNPPATPHPLATIPRPRHTPWPQSPGHATPLDHNPPATPHPLATIPRPRHTPWPQSPGHATPLGHNPPATPHPLATIPEPRHIPSLGHNPRATPHPFPGPQSPGHAMHRTQCGSNPSTHRRTPSNNAKSHGYYSFPPSRFAKEQPNRPYFRDIIDEAALEVGGNKQGSSKLSETIIRDKWTLFSIQEQQSYISHVDLFYTGSRLYKQPYPYIVKDGNKEENSKYMHNKIKEVSLKTENSNGQRRH
ncbi:vegetative cell wall protein gp1-like [Penaeus chinensis]|uniref:vegetative cell wall protein gp1-like n=1 Tax=Penaeus chinensis TaxID=139456 RepID=UPI001FB5DA17|nr:vegetative cell wall protein gp1-like [Penaeus chinensis]